MDKKTDFTIEQTKKSDSTKRLVTYSIKDVAEILGVSRPTVQKHITNGDIPAVKLGRQWIISEDNLREFINGADNRK